MKITTERLRVIIKEELMMEQGEPPFRTGLSPDDILAGRAFDTPATDPERLGDMIAAAMEGGIRDVLQTELGDKRGIEIFDRYLSDVDEEILRIAMIMRDHALELTGEPEGVLGQDEELEL